MIYVACLNRNSYLGYNDWRVPNYREYLSLIHFDKPALLEWLNTQGFKFDIAAVNGNFYGSSTTHVINQSAEGLVDFFNLEAGMSFVGTKSFPYGNNWFVRGGNGGKLPTMYPVNITTSGFGAGVVLSSFNNANWDKSDIVVHYASGTKVTFSAVPDRGYVFSGWSGDCSGSGVCQLTMDNAKNVTAIFGLGTSQDITVSTPAPISAAYNSQFTVAATAPGGVVTYSSGSPNICTNSGATFTMIAPTGTCIVLYNQSGNSNYTVAPQLANSTTIKASQTISSITFNPTSLVVGGTSFVSATATSGLAVSFSSTTPAICTVNGNTATGVTIGSCVIVADQAGDGNYSAAPQVTQIWPVRSGYVPQQLTVVKSGVGSGNVLLSAGLLSWVDNTGTTRLNSGDTIILSAIPDSGSVFLGWSGACTGTGTCQLNVDGDKSAVATFDNRFVLRQDGTVFDSISKLVWLKDANCIGIQNWNIASGIPGTLTSGQCGLSDGSLAGDWRMPTLDELLVLINDGYRDNTLLASGFINVQDFYWSSDRFYNDPWFVAFIVSMRDGSSPWSACTNYGYSWPVRPEIFSLGISLLGGGCGRVSPNTGNIFWSGNNGSARYSSGTTITLTVLPESGSVFVGWSGACNGTGPCQVTMDAAKSVTATFSIGNYTIVFNSNGGSAVNNLSVPYHGTATAPTVPIKIGYTFAGWYADSGLTTLFAFTTPITADITLYAKWTINNYTITSTAGIGGSISCNPTSVVSGNTSTCTINATNGYTINTPVGGNCGGTLSGATSPYTFITNPVTNNCTVDATFSDIQAPTLTVSTLSSGTSTSTGILNIEGSVSDNTGIKDLTIDGKVVPVNSDGSFSYPVILHPGTTTITIVVTDLNGNQATDKRTITFDQMLPALTVNSPADNSTVKNNYVTVSGMLNDPNATVAVTVNGGDPSLAALSGSSYSATVNLAAGLNTLEITVTDLSGKKNSAKRTVISDNQGPTVNITTPAQDIETTIAAQTIAGTIADAVTPISVTISDGVSIFTPTVINGAFSQDITLIDVKNYTITVTVEDGTGRKTTVQRNILYQKTNAIRTVVTPTSTNSQTVSGTMEVGTTVTIDCPTATVGPVTYPSATTWQVALSNLKEGANPLTATFTASSGLEMNASVVIVVDLSPTITSFTPTSGSVGTSVIISGTNFTGATAVMFNTVPAKPFTVVSATSITTSVPVGAATGKISVIGPSGTGTSIASFTVPPPTVTSFTPASGAVGTTVTITGTNFQGATGVKFNTTPVTLFTVVSATSLTTTVPVGATTGKISVTSPGGTGTSTANFTVSAPTIPTITSFTPASGVYMATVTITGTNFLGATAVKFNAIPVTSFAVVSATSITTTVPVGATTGKISVTGPSGTGTSAGNFTVPAPTVTSFTPTSGMIGATVTLTGTNFLGATGVKFNTIPVTSYNVINATSLTTTVPVGATTGKISVTGPSGTGTSTGNFNVIGPPTITSFTPASGVVGATVTITGTNLLNETSVTFNGIAATITTNIATSIKATVPVGATTGLLRVSTAAGAVPSATNFTVPAPTVTSFTPSSGAAGATVTITGTNFLGATGVTFNTTPATSFTVVSATSITATVPVGATTGTIKVTGPSGTGTRTASFMIIGAPTITSFTPASGVVGATVTITGTSLESATAVTFNGIAATIVTNTATSISTKVPTGATTGPISVITAVGKGTSATNFTVQAPTVTSFTPTTGAAGATVTITGTNFLGATGVTFNTTPATLFTVVSATSITATVPVGATTGTIKVTGPSGTGTSAASFTVIGAPVITSFTPVSGLVGTAVTITGTSLGSATAVTFNGIPALIVSNTATSISTKVPAGTTTGPISVTTALGTGTSSTSFTVPAPTITSFTPATGGVGTGVTITGTNFTGATVVKFNGTSAPFVVVSATSIATSVPVGATTGAISVTTYGGVVTSATTFTVGATAAVPKVTSFTPTTGGVGATVTLTGTNFVGTTAVKFNGSAVTAFTVISNTSLVTAVPTGATTGTISMTTAGGIGTSTTSFTVGATPVAPTITSFTPATGKVGTDITVTGTNLGGVKTATIGGVNAFFKVKSGTSVVITVPTGAVTGSLVVTTDGGSATSATSYTVTP